MRVRYSRRATQDLAAIHDYLIRRSPRGAINVLTSIYASVEFIRRHAEAAQTTNISGIRAMVVRRYRFKIFYRVVKADNAIEIVHVRHTSRRAWIREDD
jgi:toxin ParE1/3/4